MSGDNDQLRNHSSANKADEINRVRNAVDRAVVLIDLERYDEAVSIINSALVTNPDHYALWLHLCQAHIRAGRIAPAEKAAREAVRLKPDDEYGHIFLAQTASAFERHDEARLHLHEAVRLAPHNWKTHCQKARLLIRGGEFFTEAYEAAHRAVELAPTEADTHLALGIVELTAGNWDNATVSLGRALELEPENATAMSLLASCEQKRGRTGKAAAIFSQAAARDLDNPYAKWGVDHSLWFLALTTLALETAGLLLLIPLWLLLPSAGEGIAVLTLVGIVASRCAWQVRHFSPSTRVYVRSLRRTHRKLFNAIIMVLLSNVCIISLGIVAWLEADVLLPPLTSCFIIVAFIQLLNVGAAHRNTWSNHQKNINVS